VFGTFLGINSRRGAKKGRGSANGARPRPVAWASSGPARVVQVDVRGDHGGQVGGCDPEPGQRRPCHWGRGAGPGLDQARAARPDALAGGDPLVTGHLDVDLEDLVA
jgi:hypothetical protein